MNSVLPILFLACVATFFLCRSRSLNLRIKGQIMGASSTHWGWYGVMQVSIPIILFSSFIWGLELYFFNSAIKVLGADLFETTADLHLLRESIRASLNAGLLGLAPQGFMGLLMAVISYWSGGLETYLQLLSESSYFAHLQLFLHVMRLKMQF